MPDYATNYRAAQGRIMSLVNNQNAGLPVPACPGWTIRDVIAHLAGLLGDHRFGIVREEATPERAAEHVEKRRHRSLADVGAEWHLLGHHSPHAFQEYGQVLVADIVSHEFDIRGALGNTQGRDLPVVRSATLFFLSAVDYLFREEGVPPLRILVEDKALDLGEGEPQATVEMGWWESLRLTSGRRSIAQARAVTWSTDPEPWLEHLFIFGPRETDLAE